MNASNGIVRREGGRISIMAAVKASAAEQLLRELHAALDEKAEWIMLTVCSAGGDRHIAVQLYSRIWKMMRANAKWVGRQVPLWTCALGDVVSAGVILFMVGEKRYIDHNVVLGFHEPSISLVEGEQTIAVQEIRDSIVAIGQKQQCFCDDMHVRTLLRHLAMRGDRVGDRLRPYVHPLGAIEQRLQKLGGHQCDHGRVVVQFLQELVNIADHSSHVYAGIIARRAGMPVEQVCELMKRSARVDANQACILGLAHECV